MTKPHDFFSSNFMRSNPTFFQSPLHSINHTHICMYLIIKIQLKLHHYKCHSPSFHLSAEVSEPKYLALGGVMITINYKVNSTFLFLPKLYRSFYIMYDCTSCMGSTKSSSGWSQSASLSYITLPQMRFKWLGTEPKKDKVLLQLAKP